MTYTSDFKPKDNWLNKRRANNRIGAPIGYMPDPEGDLTIWVPNPEAIYWIEQAFDYIDNDSFSYREAAGWISEKIGRSVSHSAVRDNWRLYRAATSKSLIHKAN